MKINKIKIDNFGTLSNFVLDLSDNVNYVCEDNGYGKTTLGAFIKVMFYGFDNEKAKKVADRERSKYKPWQGGAYGGTIEFEVDNKNYVLDRLFGDKASEDRSTLRNKKTKTLSSDFDLDNLGKDLFNIDAGSFSRTMFLSQNEYDTGSFNDIDSKIGNMIDNTDDMNNFESATELLEDNIGKLSKKRKPYGLIENNDERINALKQEVKVKSSLESSIHTAATYLDEANDYILEKTEEKNKIDSKLQIIGNKKDIAALKKEYDIIVKNYNDESNKLKTIYGYFNNQEPDEGELVTCESKLMQLESEKAHLDENTLPETDKQLQLELNSKFKGITISTTEFNKIQSILGEQTKLKNEISNISLSEDEKNTFNNESKVFSIPFNETENEKYINIWNQEREEKKRSIDSLSLSFTEKEKLNSLNKIFNDKPLNIDLVDSYIAKLMNNNYASTISELNNRKAIEDSKNGQSSNMIGLIIMLICVIVGLVIGFIMDKLAIGIGLMAAGVAAMAVTSIKNSSKNKREKETKINEIDKRIAEIQNKDKQLKSETKQLIESYGIKCDTGNEALVLNKLKENYVDYLDLNKKSDEMASRQFEYKNRIIEIENSVYSYLKKYGINADETNALPKLHELQSRYNRYNSLKFKGDSSVLIEDTKKYESNKGIIEQFFKKFGLVNVKEEEYFDAFNKLQSSYNKLNNLNVKTDAYEQAKKSIDDLNKEITSIFVKYGKTGQFNWKAMSNEMHSQVALYNQTKNKCISLYTEKTKFEKEHPNYNEFDTAANDVEDVSLEELTTKSKELQGEIDYWKSEKDRHSDGLTSLNDKYNEICDKEGEIESLTKTNIELTEKLNILKKALAHLTEAKETLNSKYGTPIENSLSKYFKELANKANFEVSVNANKELIIKAKGAERDIRALSKGYGDIVDLCFRMSLTDAMYTDEKPLIILDDPFINLDESKVDSGLKFLKEIGRDHQVLYLTCHESRMPNRK